MCLSERGSCLAWLASARGGERKGRCAVVRSHRPLAPSNALPPQLRYVRQATVSARGTAVVVDGAALLLTPLRHTVVPPPLCAAAAALPAAVACVAIRDCGEGEAVAAVLSDGGIALLQCVEDDLWEETLEEQLEAAPWQG